MSATAIHRPGRLGHPDMTIAQDPRADPRMTAVLELVGMAGHGEPSPATAKASTEDLYAWVNEAEPGFEMPFGDLPPAPLAGTAGMS